MPAIDIFPLTLFKVWNTNGGANVDPLQGQTKEVICFVCVLFPDTIIASAHFSPFFKFLSKREYKRKKPF